MLFQGTDGFHKRAFKVIADTHNFSGSFHLCGKGSLGADKFVKGQPGDLYHAVVQHRFKAGISLACDSVFDLIQRVAQGDLRRNLGNGIAGRLGSQGRRTGHTGIYLDNAVFKTVGI